MVNIIGLDVERDMINKAIELTDDDNVLYSCSSLFDEDITNTSFITSYYTLQFISPSVRQDAG